MKFDIMCILEGKLFIQVCKKKVLSMTGMEKSQILLKKVYDEYKGIVVRAGELGPKDRMKSPYITCAYFIALCRSMESYASADECYSLMEDALRKSKNFKALNPSAKRYLSESMYEKRLLWSENIDALKYKNTWVAKVYPKCKEYDYGVDYLECGICKLCKDEKVESLAKYLCKFDYLIAEIMGIKLSRTGTIANRSKYCDFRYLL